MNDWYREFLGSILLHFPHHPVQQPIEGYCPVDLEPWRLHAALTQGIHREVTLLQFVLRSA